MTKFRPCIDLHHGRVKQIVGGTLSDNHEAVVENFVANQSAPWFAEKYRRDALSGGHVIKLGPGNDEAARAALAAFPGGLQIGGGINSENAAAWIDAGASHVIVTSWLFTSNGDLATDRLAALSSAVGKDRIVLDLSCRRVAGHAQPRWRVAMNRWQTLTNLEVSAENFELLAGHASEFLIHAADVEGLCKGIDTELVRLMGDWAQLPMTYAGGVATMDDVLLVETTSRGSVDVTVGSALDLFGGTGVSYASLVEWNRR